MKSLKIPKGQSESVNPFRCGHTNKLHKHFCAVHLTRANKNKAPDLTVGAESGKWQDS